MLLLVLAPFSHAQPHASLPQPCFSSLESPPLPSSSTLHSSSQGQLFDHGCDGFSTVPRSCTYPDTILHIPRHDPAHTPTRSHDPTRLGRQESIRPDTSKHRTRHMPTRYQSISMRHRSDTDPMASWSLMALPCSSLPPSQTPISHHRTPPLLSGDPDRRWHHHHHAHR